MMMAITARRRRGQRAHARSSSSRRAPLPLLLPLLLLLHLWSAGDRDGDAFVSFINEKAGTHRSLSGALLPTAGLVPELTPLAQEFAAEGADKAAVLARAKTVAGGLSGGAAKAAEVYTKIMEKALEKVSQPAPIASGAPPPRAAALRHWRRLLCGVAFLQGADYIGKERARLKSMLEKGTIAPAKKTDIAVRYNVLNTFEA